MRGARRRVPVCARPRHAHRGHGGRRRGLVIDHCVQAVGLDTTASTPYWIVRNSWGVTWGEKGFIYLEYGDNTCAIASNATYTTGATAV